MARVLRGVVDVPTDLEIDISEAGPIFNYNEVSAMDNKRLQLAVNANKGPLAAMCKAVEARLREIGILHDEHHADEWALLISEPGCQRQHWHTDYDPKALQRLDVVPLILLLGLESGTRLHVDDGLVELGPGDVAVMRGDTVHAGAAYAERNVRLHAYADVAGVDRAPDTVHLVY